MNERDPHVATGPWKFDSEVTAVFDTMLRNSIPGYEDMRWTTTNLASYFLELRKTAELNIADLGASRGEALKPLYERFPDSRFFAYECSEPMQEVLKQLPVTLISEDLRTTDMPSNYFDAVLSVLTLMFIPVEHRQALLRKVFNALKPGGVLFLVEKTLGQDATTNNALVYEYLSMKRRNGYTDEQIERKRLALEGVLVPLTASWNEGMLQAVGFQNIECYWKTLMFTGWFAIKPSTHP